jgi:hypothetical protein
MVWFNVLHCVDLFERKSFENESSKEMLVTPNYHGFSELVVMSSNSTIKILREEVELLGDSLNASRFLFFTLNVHVDSWNESDPNFVFADGLNQGYVVVVGASIFNSNPLILSYFIVLSFVILKDGGHFVCRYKNELVKNTAEASTSFPNIRFFPCFNIDVTLS